LEARFDKVMRKEEEGSEEEVEENKEEGKIFVCLNMIE
jgi:hypothetical protein